MHRIRSCALAALLAVFASLTLATPVMATTAPNPAVEVAAKPATIKEVEAKIKEVGKKETTRWNDRAKRLKVTLPAVAIKVIQPGKSFKSACGRVDGNTPNAYYCAGEGKGGTILLPLQTMHALANGNVYDMGTLPSNLVYVKNTVSYGFTQAFWQRYVAKMKVASPAYASLYGDCGAGDAANLTGFTTWERQLSREFFTIIADENPGGAHGTAAQRVTAFDIGEELGMSGCTAYWAANPLAKKTVASKAALGRSAHNGGINRRMYALVG